MLYCVSKKSCPAGKKRGVIKERNPDLNIGEKISGSGQIENYRLIKNIRVYDKRYPDSDTEIKIPGSEYREENIRVLMQIHKYPDLG